MNNVETNRTLVDINISASDTQNISTSSFLTSLLCLIGATLMFPTILMIILLACTRVIKLTTALLIGFFFLIFYAAMLYSMYTILYAYLKLN